MSYSEPNWSELDQRAIWTYEQSLIDPPDEEEVCALCGELKTDCECEDPRDDREEEPEYW